MPPDIPDWTGQHFVQLLGLSGAILGDPTAPAPPVDLVTVSSTSRGTPLIELGMALASFKAAAGATIARVGNLGAQAVGAQTVAPAFGQATTAGHLLVAWLSGGSNIGTLAAGAGWVKAVEQSATPPDWSQIWIKPNCGAAEAAPSFNGGGALRSTLTAQLGEFSGVATVAPTDQTAAGTSSGSPLTLGMGLADAANGDLVLAAAVAHSAQFNNIYDWIFTFNGGAGVYPGSSSGWQAPGFAYAINIPQIATAPLLVEYAAGSAPLIWQAPTSTVFKDSGVGATGTLLAGVAGQTIRLWGGQLSVLTAAAGTFVVLADSNNNQLLTLPADAKGVVAFNFGGAPLAAGAGLVVTGTGGANGRAAAAVSQG